MRRRASRLDKPTDCVLNSLSIVLLSGYIDSLRREEGKNPEIMVKKPIVILREDVKRFV